MEGITVEIGVDRHTGDSQFLAGPDHSYGDLPPVGDQDFFERLNDRHGIWLPDMNAEYLLSILEGTRFSTISHVAETGSTNADLFARASDPTAPQQILVTDHQNAGRGRQARTWHDEEKNSVLMSALVRLPIHVACLIPIVMGVAAIDGLEAAVPELGLAQPVKLKWPNDLVVPGLGDRKLAGILAEAAPPDRSMMPIVVGIGMNLAWSQPPPAEIADKAVTLQDLTPAGSPVVDRWDVVQRIVTAFDQRLSQTEANPANILDEYRKRCVTIGRTIRLETPSGDITGRATGVEDSGALLVKTESGVEIVTAGDAHHI